MHGHDPGEGDHRRLGGGLRRGSPEPTRNRLLLCKQLSAELELNVITHHQRQHQNHTEGGDARRSVEKHRRDRGDVLQPPEAGVTLDDVLVTILGEDPLIRLRVSVEVIRDQDEVARLEPEQLHSVRRLCELLDLLELELRNRRCRFALGGSTWAAAFSGDNLGHDGDVGRVELELADHLVERPQCVRLTRVRTLRGRGQVPREHVALPIEPAFESRVFLLLELARLDHEVPKGNLTSVVVPDAIPPGGERTVERTSSVDPRLICLRPTWAARDLRHLDSGSANLLYQSRADRECVRNKRHKVEALEEQRADGLTVHELAVSDQGDVVLFWQKVAEHLDVEPIGHRIGGVPREHSAGQRDPAAAVQREAEDELLEIVCLRQDCVNRRGGLNHARMRGEATPTWVAPRATAPAASVYAASTWRDSRRASAPA